MSICLEIAGVDRRGESFDLRQNKLHAIGEILPFVMAKYDLGVAIDEVNRPLSTESGESVPGA